MTDKELQNGGVPDSKKEENPFSTESTAVEGIYLPPTFPGAPSWPDKIRDLRQMTLRDDDIILLTYPKAGTHWLWEVISMLRKGSAEHDANTKVQLMMEFVQNHILDDMPSPRTFNTHLPLSMLPVDKIKARRLKLVHVYRNPKDTCVSMYHMARSSPQMSSVVPCETFGDFAVHYFFTDKRNLNILKHLACEFEQLMAKDHAPLCFLFGAAMVVLHDIATAVEREKIFGSYVKYLKQMHAFQEQNPEVPTFNMSYEDVKKVPVGSVKKLASFLSLSVSDEVCVQIADECSFDKMKAKEAEKEKPKLHSKTLDKESLERMEKNKPVIFRKGQIGDWKNYFTVAMSERVDRFLEEQLKDLPFTLTFE